MHKVLETASAASAAAAAQVVVTKRGQSNHDTRVFAKQRATDCGRKEARREVAGQIKAALGVVAGAATPAAAKKRIICNE